MKKRRRPKEYLYVDAYNIINHWDKLKNALESSLEDARRELLEALSEYSHYTGIKVIAVFDAYRVEGSSKEDLYKGVEVVFTESGQTADNYIERVLDMYGKQRRIRVASSDRLEQETVLGRGGTRLTAAELEVEIYNIDKTLKRNMDSMRTNSALALNEIDDDIKKRLEDFKNRLVRGI